MRIGVNTLFLVPGDVGGTEVYLRESLKEMVPAHPDDRFILFTSKDNEEVLRQDLAAFEHVSFVQMPFRSAARPVRILAEQSLLPYQVWKNSIDVLWSPGYTAPLWSSCPQVVTIHDLQYKTHPDDLTFPERIALDFLVRNACRRCQAVIAVSEFSKNEIVRFNFASDSKISVIYEGVDPAFGQSSDQAISDLPGISEKTPFILCVAHTYPHKQVHLLVEAFGQVMENIPHHLVLVGKPRRGEAKVQKRLKKISNRQKIHRISDVTYKELISLYQASDIFVLPSTYEGFGLPVLEALLAGSPVITTQNGSLPEVGGVHAVYLSQDDAGELAKAITDSLGRGSKEKEERVVKGKTWAASFTWKNSADATMKTLKRVPASRKSTVLNAGENP